MKKIIITKNSNISDEDREAFKEALKNQVNPLVFNNDAPLFMYDFKKGTKERIN